MSSMIQALAEFEQQAAQKFPFEAVEAHLREDRVSEIADLLGVSVDFVRRVKEDGLGVDEADRVACKLGDHPSAIWSDWNKITPISERMLNEIEIYMVTHKKCARCGDWKHKMDEFNKRTTSPDGRARYCRTCTRDYERQRKATRQRETVDA